MRINDRELLRAQVDHVGRLGLAFIDVFNSELVGLAGEKKLGGLSAIARQCRGDASLKRCVWVRGGKQAGYGDAKKCRRAGGGREWFQNRFEERDQSAGRTLPSDASCGEARYCG